MRLVHLVFGFDVGGLERIVKNSIESMPDTIEHTVVCLSTANREFVNTIKKPIKVYELRKPPGNNLFFWFKVFTLLKQLKPHVLHSYNLATLEYQLFAALLGIKVRVHAEHGRDLADPEGKNKKYKLWRRIFSRFVHFHVCVSNDLYYWLVNDVGIPKSRAKLIRNGVDTSYYCANKTSRKVIEPTSDKLTFGHVARLDGIKNQANLIKAFSHACQENEGFKHLCKLVIVGEGSERKNLESLIKEINEPVDIALLGAKSDMLTQYHSFDAFALSSDAEGIPMTILEAMSCELPILSTNVGGIPEILESEYSVMVTPKCHLSLADGFISMFNKRKEWSKMGKVARSKAVKEFSQHSMNEAYFRLYQFERE